MTRLSRLGAVAAVAALLAGCSASGAGTEPSAEPSHASHTMPDGTVMEGGSHEHDGEKSETPQDAGPSAAAQMVCGGDVSADVTRLLGLPEDPEPTWSWAEPMFTCTYELEGGPLVLSVHDATGPRSGREHFESLRTELGNTEELRGMYGLGLPAYKTDDGTAVFIKDGKTLRVDATALPGDLGPDRSMSQTDFAYAMATSVLACWTAHT